MVRNGKLRLGNYELVLNLSVSEKRKKNERKRKEMHDKAKVEEKGHYEERGTCG